MREVYVVRHSIQCLLPAPAAAVVPSSPTGHETTQKYTPYMRARRRFTKFTKPSAWGPLAQVSGWGKGSSGVSHEITHAFGEKGSYLVTSDRSKFPTGGPDDPPDLPISPTDIGRNWTNCPIWRGVLSSFSGNPV